MTSQKLHVKVETVFINYYYCYELQNITNSNILKTSEKQNIPKLHQQKHVDLFIQVETSASLSH